MRPRPVLHETEAEIKTNYCQTETETKRPRWSRDLNTLLLDHNPNYGNGLYGHYDNKQ